MTLREFFSAHPKAALAFSGGADSAYLLHAAREAGADVKPYFIQTPFQPKFELEDAKRLAPDLTVVTMNGLSKSHCLCGYRCGWLVISGPRGKTEEYRRGLVELTSMRLCANALAQLVIPAALEDMQTPLSMVSPGGRIYEQRKATLDVLENVEGLSFVKNAAAFYLFPRLDAKKFHITNDKVFARDLLQATNILVVPGSGFDWPEPDHFRIVMLPEAKKLGNAMQRLGKFLETYQQQP